MKFTGKWQGHQGDVQIFSIDELPKGAKKIKNQFHESESGNCFWGEMQLRNERLMICSTKEIPDYYKFICCRSWYRWSNFKPHWFTRIDS